MNLFEGSSERNVANKFFNGLMSTDDVKGVSEPEFHVNDLKMKSKQLKWIIIYNNLTVKPHLVAFKTE